jgi:hypothetical protein
MKQAAADFFDRQCLRFFINYCNSLNATFANKSCIAKTAETRARQGKPPPGLLKLMPSKQKLKAARPEAARQK